MIRTYIISMSYPDALMQSVPQLGLLPVWLPGTKGKEVSDYEKQQYISPNYIPFATPGSIGCSMSHMRAWEEFLKSGENCALILEDDVVFEPDFTQQMHRAMEEAPADYDILALGCFGCTGDYNLFAVGQSIAGIRRTDSHTLQINPYVSAPSSFQGAHAYIITRQGAERCLKHLKGHVSHHIDYAIADLLQRGLIRLYTCTPRIAFQTSSDSENVSQNTSASHPLILTTLLKHIKVDKLVSAEYLYSVGAYRIGPLTLIPGDLLFFALGILVAACRLPLLWVSAAFLVLTVPDLMPGSGVNPWQIAWHYALLIAPGLLAART